MEQHSDASFAALGFVRHWEYTRNNTFLQHVSYPFLKLVAQWWTCWLKKVPGALASPGTAGLGPYVLQVRHRWNVLPRLSQRRLL